MRRLRLSLLALLFVSSMACSSTKSQKATIALRAPRVLLYAKETEWLHDSNSVATQVMLERGKARGWEVTSTKDSSVFTSPELADIDVVVFLLSSGMTMSQAERDAFASYIREGHGWVGVHSASHTDYDWTFMNELVGANFCCHSPMMLANIDVEDASDPIVAQFPKVFSHMDEWYTFDRRPEANAAIKVLLAFDESSAGPDYPGAQPQLRVGYHPITWKQQYGATRSFYTALGHPVDTWSDSNFLEMIDGAIEWAAGDR